MIITSKINMDLVRRGVTPMVEAVQDDKYSRNLEINLYADGIPLEISSNAVAVVRFMKPDSTGGSYDTLPDGSESYSIIGNLVTVAIAPQVCTAPGLVRLAVSLIEGEVEVNTFTVHLNVHSNPGIDTNSEDYTNMRAYIKSFGWTPGVYLGTDENGNVVAVDAPESGEDGYTPRKGVDYWTEEEVAQTREEIMEALPVTVTEEGYTDIAGLRQAVAMDFALAGNVITAAVTLEGDVTVTSTITLDDDGYPVTITTDGVECAVSWEGF